MLSITLVFKTSSYLIYNDVMYEHMISNY